VCTFAFDAFAPDARHPRSTVDRGCAFCYTNITSADFIFRTVSIADTGNGASRVFADLSRAAVGADHAPHAPAVFAFTAGAVGVCRTHFSAAVLHTQLSAQTIGILNALYAESSRAVTAGALRVPGASCASSRDAGQTRGAIVLLFAFDTAGRSADLSCIALTGAGAVGAGVGSGITDLSSAIGIGGAGLGALPGDALEPAGAVFISIAGPSGN